MSNELVRDVINSVLELATTDNEERVKISISLIETAILNELRSDENQRSYLTFNEITDRLNLPYLGNKNSLARYALYNLQDQGIVRIYNFSCWLVDED